MSPHTDEHIQQLRKCIPINSFVDEAFDRLVNVAEFQQYKQNELIFNIGDNDIYSLFLLDGEIQLLSKDNKQSYISSGYKQSLYAIAELKPRMFSAIASKDNVLIAKIPSETLDKLLIWDQEATDTSSSKMEVNDISLDFDDDDNEWKLAMLQSDIFLTLPSANIMSLFDKMETIEVKKGEQIITQGDEADYYYMIKEGHCLVNRTADDDMEPIVINELGPMECFGEEAIVSGNPRNANVIMKTDGKLVRLGKEQFHSLLEEPLLTTVDLATAKQHMQEGAIPIDVRTEDEFANSGINNTTNIPLYLLRLKMLNMDKNASYVMLCDTGARSSAAAFVMIRAGFKHVYILQNGINGQG